MGGGGGGGGGGSLSLWVEEENELSAMGKECGSFRRLIWYHITVSRIELSWMIFSLYEYRRDTSSYIHRKPTERLSLTNITE